MVNAVNINDSFTKWLIFALAPEEVLSDMARDELASNRVRPSNITASDREDDDILGEQIIEASDGSPSDLQSLGVLEPDEVQPEIGLKDMTSDQLASIGIDLDERPPKKFDHEREVLVYNGYLQFVEMKLSGVRLSGRTIKIPDDILNIATPNDQVAIKATCKIIENLDQLCPDLKDFERRVNVVRRCYTQTLGDELGSVILSSNRAAFDKEIIELKDELEDLVKTAQTKIEGALQLSFNQVKSILFPLVMQKPPSHVLWQHNFYDKPIDTCVEEFLDGVLHRLFPSKWELTDEFDLRCQYKDVTWETLNDKAFGDAIRRVFPKEKFTKLYLGRTTIAERSSTHKPSDTREDWPESIDN